MGSATLYNSVTKLHEWIYEILLLDIHWTSILEGLSFGDEFLANEVVDMRGTCQWTYKASWS